MPNVRDRLNPSGARIYFIDFWDPWKGKRVWESVGTRKGDAQKRASQVYNELMQRWLGDDKLRQTDIAVPDLFLKFIRGKEGRVSARTIRRYQIHIQHFLQFLDRKFQPVLQARQVQRSYIEDHLEELRRQGQQPKTLNAQ